MLIERTVASGLSPAAVFQSSMLSAMILVELVAAWLSCSVASNSATDFTFSFLDVSGDAWLARWDTFCMVTIRSPNQPRNEIRIDPYVEKTVKAY
jgi:hypothetical protein